jgi:small redox-active disulfide protein 2
MEIKVLGPGCRNCVTLELRVREALAQTGIEARVEKIEDYDEILAYGIMATPGLVIDNQVMLSGKVPTVSALAELISEKSSS